MTWYSVYLVYHFSVVLPYIAVGIVPFATGCSKYIQHICFVGYRSTKIEDQWVKRLRGKYWFINALFLLPIPT